MSASRRVTLKVAVPARLSRQSVTLDLVDEPTMTGGVGGWSTIPRPRRTAAAEWLSVPERTQVVPLLINGLEAGGPGIDVSIEPTIAALINWGRPVADTGEPPILAIAGPVKATDGRWVINDLAWAEERRDLNGRRTQAKVTVTLLEYLEAKVLKSPAKKHKGKGK